jgi:ribosomal protein S18 acetylase RimI-like enzyme
MGVAAAVRGQGWGRRILAAALARAEASAVLEIVYLMVRADNLPAVRLYAAAGFETLAVLASDTRVGDRYHDGLLMRRFVRGGAAPPSAR